MTHGLSVISFPTPAAAAASISLGISTLGNTSGTSGLIGGNAAQMVFAGGNNVTLSQSINGISATLTISAGAGGGGLTNINLSAGTTSNNLSNFVMANSNGISFGLNGSTITASHNGLTSQSNQALSAANGSFTFQTATFANSNGISFSTGTQGIFASHNGLTSQSNQALSAGNGSFTFQTATFADSNGISFSTGTQGLFASHNGLTSQSGQALSAGNGSFAFQTASFSNANGISFSTSAGSAIVASHNGLTSQSNQALSGANGSFTFQTATFANSNGVSFSTGTQGMFASHNGITSQSNQQFSMYAVSNTTQSSSGTGNASALSFNGAGIASVGISNGSVVISVPSGGGGLTNVNLSAGTTSQNLSNFVFSNSNNVSFGLNGSTVTASAKQTVASWYEIIKGESLGTAALMNNGTYSRRPIFVPFGLDGVDLASVASVRMYASRTGGTSLSGTIHVGFYTANNSTQITLISSTSMSLSLSTSAQFSGIRAIDVTGLSNLSLAGSKYILGLIFDATATAVMGLNVMGAGSFAPVGWLLGGTSTSATQSTWNLYPFWGRYSTTSAGLPDSVNRTQIIGGAGNQSPDIYAALLAV